MNEGVRAPGRTHTLSRQPEAPVFVAEIAGWLKGLRWRRRQNTAPERTT
jgi:hypothetical protein